MSDPALPKVNPRTVLFEPKVSAVAALVIVTSVPPGLVPGKGSLCGAGGLTPEMLERVSVASCPMNFCPASKITEPL